MIQYTIIYDPIYYYNILGSILDNNSIIYDPIYYNHPTDNTNHPKYDPKILEIRNIQ